uniref:Uncharacterized protein n=1 Tax=Oryza rufipogon TaxID=4529 RepID=A0A0E0R1K7_ORYRU
MASRHIGGDLTCRKAAFALVRDEVHGLPIPKSIEHVLKDCTYRCGMHASAVVSCCHPSSGPMPQAGAAGFNGLISYSAVTRGNKVFVRQILNAKDKYSRTVTHSLSYAVSFKSGGKGLV